MVKHDGEYHFPVFGTHYEGRDFGQRVIGEADYRALAEQFAEEGEGNWVLMPPYPYHPNESLLTDPNLPGTPPHAPTADHWMGTDDRARDVFSRLVYGFRISLGFGLGVVSIGYLIGVTLGSILGFFGGKVDIIGQRIVEIWAGLPFLYTVIIVSSLIKPGLGMLMLILACFRSWGVSQFSDPGEFPTLASFPVS